MNHTEIIQLVSIVILILMSSFFSSAETALSTIGEIKAKSMMEEKRAGAGILYKVVSDYSKMISTILVGNNIVNIAVSSIVTTFTIDLFGSRFIGYATGILTLLVLLFGEIVPKSVAKIRADSLALVYAPVIYALMTVLTPVLFIIDIIAKAIMWIIRINPNEKNAITEAELRTIVDAGHQDGVIESEEKEMINNVFDFSDSVAKEIMIPNIDMVCIEESATYDEVMLIFKDGMYTRLPVYRGERDNIIGIINIKDFIFIEDKKNFKIENIMRSAYYTYEYKKTADLMIELKAEAAPIAFILSEYGACVGMVSMEDLLEEIVGEIRDEFDEEELDSIKKVEKNVYIIHGNRKLDDINDEIGTNFESEEYDSIAGIILENLDRIPEEGDEVILGDGVKLKVNQVVKNRITKVRVELPEIPESED